MPAASCLIMPARSIRRCETISASFGFSFRMGRKNRDSRMETLEESVRGCSETGLGTKTQGRERGKAANAARFLSFFRRLQVRLEPASRCLNFQLVLNRNHLEIGHKCVDPHVPAAGERKLDPAHVPIAVRPGVRLALERLDAAFGQA